MRMEDPQPEPPLNLSHDDGSRSTRIMAHLRDSLISQLTELDPSLSIHSHSSFLIQRRLQQLFHSFHTPTHPPYALMIRRAIMELNEGTGSTEEAISEFIKREYNDLPWAHVRILGLHLGKLCQVGELACAEGGTYVLLLDGEETEQCKGSKNRKRGNMRSNHGDGERKGTVESCEGVEKERDNGLQEEGIKEQIQVSELDIASTDGPSGVVEWTQQLGEQPHSQSIERVEESEKEIIEVIGKQSRHTEAELQARSELEESQIQVSMLHLETICSSQPTSLSLPFDSQQPLLVPISEGLPKCLPAAGIGLSPAQLQLQMSCHGPSETSLDPAAKMSGSLSSLNVQEHKQDEKSVSVDPERQDPNLQCRSRPRKCKQVADYQGESLLPSGDTTVSGHKPNVKKIGKWWLLQPQGQGIGRGRRPKLHRNSHCINKKIQPQDQAEDLVCSSYSNRKETSYSSQPTVPNFAVNLTHNFGQQLVVPTSEGSPECIISTGIKLSPTQSQLQISSDIDLGIVSKRKTSLTCENVHDEQPQHYNQGSPNGNLDKNPMSRGSEQKPPKRPRGRPPKVEAAANYPEESLLPLDDGIHNEQKPNVNKMEKQRQYGRGRGRGRPGQIRGRGRPPKLNQNQNAKQCGEQLQQEDQAKQRGQGRGRGRPPKPNRNTIQYEEQSQQEDQAQQHSRGRGRGRGRPPKLNQITNKCEAELQQEVQAQQQHVQGRGQGRPPKLNQNTNQREEQLQPQDQAQGLVNPPNSRGNDNQSLEQKQLHVQSQGKHHKSESGEAKPSAGLRLGSESRCGSGEASQSNVGSKPEPLTATATSM